MKLFQILKDNFTDEEYLLHQRELHRARYEKLVLSIEKDKEKPGYLNKCEADAANAMNNMFVLPGTEGKLFHVGTPPAWNECRTKDEEYLWHLNRMEYFKLLSRLYHITGDDKYAKKVLADIENWIDSCPVAPLPTDSTAPEQMSEILNFYSGLTPWRSLEVGIRTFDSWDYAYDCLLFSDLMTPELHTKIAYSFYEHALVLREMSPRYWPDANHNHYIHEMLGLFKVAHLFPNFDVSDGWSRFALSELVRCARAQFSADGGQIEGSPHYHQICLDMFFSFIEVAKNFDVAVPNELLDYCKKATEYSLICSWNSSGIDYATLENNVITISNNASTFANPTLTIKLQKNGSTKVLDKAKIYITITENLVSMVYNSQDVQVKKSNQYGVDYELKVPLAHRFYQMPTVIVDGYEEYDVFYQNSDDEYSRDKIEFKFDEDKTYFRLIDEFDFLYPIDFFILIKDKNGELIKQLACEAVETLDSDEVIEVYYGNDLTPIKNNQTIYIEKTDTNVVPLKFYFNGTELSSYSSAYTLVNSNNDIEVKRSSTVFGYEWSIKSLGIVADSVITFTYNWDTPSAEENITQYVFKINVSVCDEKELTGLVVPMGADAFSIVDNNVYVNGKIYAIYSVGNPEAINGKDNLSIQISNTADENIKKVTLSYDDQSNDDYFGLDTLKLVVRQPFGVTKTEGTFDIICTVTGGGVSGQAGAVLECFRADGTVSEDGNIQAFGTPFFNQRLIQRNIAKKIVDQIAVSVDRNDHRFFLSLENPFLREILYLLLDLLFELHIGVTLDKQVGTGLPKGSDVSLFRQGHQSLHVLKLVFVHQVVILAIGGAEKTEVNAILVHRCQFHRMLAGKTERILHVIHDGGGIQLAHMLAVLAALAVIVCNKGDG